MDLNKSERFRQCLASAEPAASLWLLAKSYRDAGTARFELLAELEALRRSLRGEKDEAGEDAVMDVMDCLVGFSSPHRRIN